MEEEEEAEDEEEAGMKELNDTFFVSMATYDV